MAYKDKKVRNKMQNEFINNAYDRINLTVPKGQKKKIQAAAKYTGESVNAFINRLIDNEIERLQRTGGSFSFSDPENLDKQV